MTADHDRLEELVAEYVLGACDERDAEVARAHLVACPSCRALAQRLMPAVDALPLAVDEMAPPERLRARILAVAAVTPQQSEPTPAARIIALPRRGAGGGGSGIGRGGAAGFPVMYWAAVAALAIVVFVLVAWNVRLAGQLDQAPARYPLVGTGAMSGASGTVTELMRQNAAVVELTGVPQPREGMVYELWLIDASNRPIPAGVFTPNHDGRVTLAVSRSLGAVRTVAVTQEAGPTGARAPTQKPELAGQVIG
ncbi:MAG TPA: anti-sigma factor [Candidatus Dormibacteraeota bacterium]